MMFHIGTGDNEVQYLRLVIHIPYKCEMCTFKILLASSWIKGIVNILYSQKYEVTKETLFCRLKVHLRIIVGMKYKPETRRKCSTHMTTD